MAKVLQITDLHILRTPDETLLGVNTEYYFQQVLQQAHSRHGQFDLILITGDLAQCACLEAYQRIHSHLAAYASPVFCVAGNHDLPEVMQQVFALDDRTTIGDWQILALHSPIPGSPVGALAQSELDKLERLLQQYPHIPTLLTMHHPSIPSGSAWMDTMQIRNSDQFWEIVVCYPQIKAIVCGHIHQELSIVNNQVQCFAAPATCFQFLANSADFAVADQRPGYRIFEFEHEQLTSYCEFIEAPEFQANPGNSSGY